MDRHTVEILQFNKIIDELDQYCLSGGGAGELREQEFLYTREELESRLTLTGDFEKILKAGCTLSGGRSPDIGPLLVKLDKEGAVLLAEEWAALRSVLERMRLLKSFVTDPEKHCSREGSEVNPDRESLLHQEVSSIPDFRPLEKEINRIITADGEVDDSLPELRSIRKSINRIQGEITESAARFFRDSAFSGYLQSDVPGQREGRVVIPVKASHKSRFPGIVQDVSSSGATVFIEPMELVEKNNELAVEKGRYAQEVHRILRELTEKVRTDVPVLDEGYAQFRWLDTHYARGRYSYIHGCARPLPEGEHLYLHEARHPHLGRSAVPITVSMGAEKKVLVISGPNTGGKTVALKTIGLIAMMHQFGMFVPLLNDSVVPLFSDIFVDIGDEQSIDLSLSTFSGHMKRISSICSAADNRALVLLDELGSGTDAGEGGAIAMAVLDYLCDRHCTVVITTHQSSLKRYAFTREDAENASVEYDVQTMRPAYRIIPGLPGESHAIEMAELIGMDGRIIDAARSYHQGAGADGQKLITELTRQIRELDGEREALQLRNDELTRRESALEARAEELDDKEREIVHQETRELNRFLSENRKKMETVIRQLKEKGLEQESVESGREIIGEAEETLRQETEKAEAAERAAKIRKRNSGGTLPIEAGMEVIVVSTKKRGTVVRKAKKGRWTVSFGNMKMDIEEDNLRSAETGHSREKGRKKIDVDFTSDKEAPPMVLDVRGLRYEEAVSSVKRQLDDSVMTGLSGFEIIHGTGEGVLQKAVKDVLDENGSVEEFHYARPEMGGFGKTIVTLRR